MLAFYGIGPFELLVIAAIIAFFAAPFVAGGIIVWIVLSRPPRRPRD